MGAAPSREETAVTLTDHMSRRVGRLVVSRRNPLVGFIPFGAAVLDLAVVALATGIALFGRSHLTFFSGAGDVYSDLSIAGPLLAIGWLLVIRLTGGYHADVFGAGTDEYRRMLNAGLITAGLTGVACYLAKFSLSRGFFLLLFTIGIPSLILGRWLLRRLVHVLRNRGRLQQRVLIAGSAAHVDEIAGVLRRETWLGYHVVGALTPARDVSFETPSGIPVLGNADDVSTMREADLVFFAGGTDTSAKQMRKIVWDLEQHDVAMVVAPSVSDTSSDRVSVRPVGGLPLMHIKPPTWSEASRVGKRTFDLVGAAALLILFSPVFLVSAAWITLHDRGPVFFRQTRTGRDAEEFTCLKFRTMVVDAEARLGALHAETGHTDGLFKMKEDPRITGPGHLLRRFSLDELPQLVNVVRGTMSLVGPRPPLPHEVADYDGDVVRRLHVRPGMTGLWQVSGRSDLSWEDTVRLDLYYVDNWSMLQDLAILFRTAGAVLGSRGAY